MDEPLRDKVLAAEKRIAGVRLWIVLSGTVLFPFFTGRPDVYVGLGYGLLASAWAYSLYAYYAEPYRRYPILLSTYLMSSVDAAFTMAWLYATGGFESPFYLALYLAVIGVAFRYRVRETLFAASVYASAYVGLLLAVGEFWGHTMDVAIRVVYLFLAAAMGAAVAREFYAQTVSRIEARRLLAEAERADARLRDAQRIAHVGSFDWDVRTHHLTWSEELYRIYGVDSKFQPTFETFLGQVHPDDRARVLRTIQRALDDGTGFELEERILWPDGSVRHVRSRGQVTLDADGHPARLTGVCFDVTGQREIEEERIRARGQAAELERLKQIARFKSDFINTAAHELSTPLTPIKLQIHLLRGTRSSWSAAESRGLEILDRSVDRLARLVEDMLDASRLQASKLGVHRQRIDLHHLLLETVETFQPMASQARVDLSWKGQEGLFVLADPKRMAQVLANVIHNAIKFTPPGGRVRVEGTTSLGGAVVRVTDTGAGLSPSQIERLFQPFSQVHQGIHPNPPGTGLGLFICRGILELHEGTIWVESRGPGRGSTFSFQVPLIDAEAEPPRAHVIAVHR